ncbi:hypothetical protein BC826DRAFT_654109 [Russula brevipes]|nr:hypothetical protein BC826DRAFT_654109 [Russula brevipes]
MIAGGATPIQPHRDVSAQLNASHPVNEHGPTSAVSMMPDTSPFTPGPVTPPPIYNGSDTAPGAYAYMPRADAAQGVTQSPVPIAYRSIYVLQGYSSGQKGTIPVRAGASGIWGSVISLSVLTIVGVIVGVLLSTGAKMPRIQAASVPSPRPPPSYLNRVTLNDPQHQ